ncbi:hypothetical protein RP20_CCG027825 [Aedes albopictus]|nr:hypothetical protein RP20_CCG027825 [Aedes albopictus]
MISGNLRNSDSKVKVDEFPTATVSRIHSFLGLAVMPGTLLKRWYRCGDCLEIVIQHGQS